MEMELIIGFFLALLAANAPIYMLLYRMSGKLGETTERVDWMREELGKTTKKVEVLQRQCPLLKEKK